MTALSLNTQDLCLQYCPAERRDTDVCTAVAISTLLYIPIAVVSVIDLSVEICAYVSRSCYHHTLAKVFTNSYLLASFSQTRRLSVTHKIEQLKYESGELQKSLSDAAKQALGQKYVYPGKLEIVTDIDRVYMQKICNTDIRINRLIHQLEKINRDDWEAIRNIAKLEYVKNALILDKLGRLIIVSLLGIFPFGHMMNVWISREDDVTHLKNNKDLLIDLPETNRFIDAVDAHNKLVSKCDYLTPFQPRTS